MKSACPGLHVVFLLLLAPIGLAAGPAWAEQEPGAKPALASETPASAAQPDPDDPDAAPPPPPLPPLHRTSRGSEQGSSDEDVPLPPKARASDELVPAVRITTDDQGQIVEEYAVNGQIYMVKVTPVKGPTYYLYDLDGDGELETRDIESDPGIAPVQWKILEWD